MENFEEKYRFIRTYFQKIDKDSYVKKNSGVLGKIVIMDQVIVLH